MPAAVSFPSLHDPEPILVPALYLPPRRPENGVVVIAHGSAGPDSRGPAFASALEALGIGSLEIDMWTPRGLKGGLDRPKSIPETLPDVFGAFVWLSKRAEVDPRRIGIAGFSWGGVLAMLTATRPYTDLHLPRGSGFAAHAPFYPVAWAYNRVPGLEFAEFTGAPVLLQCGAQDAYDPPGAPERLQADTEARAPGLLKLILHEGATHAFDREGRDVTVRDPFAHGGHGGEVLFASNPQAGEAARRAAAEFFADIWRA